MDISKFDQETKGFLRGMDRAVTMDDNDDIRYDDIDKDEINVEDEERVYNEVMETENRAQRFADMATGSGGPGNMGPGGSGGPYVNTIRAKHNTGVKGVLADYNEWRERVIAESKDAATQQMRELEAKSLRSKYEKVEEPEEDDEDWMEEDDEFFSQWKQKQAADLLSKVPVFGRVREIGVSEYVSAIDNEFESVYVVIHLYETDVEACLLVNHFMDQLAPVHKHVKFLRIVASHAQQNWQRKALPTLLVYRGGDLIQKHVDISNTITLDSALTLEEFFFGKGIVASQKYVPPPPAVST